MRIRLANSAVVKVTSRLIIVRNHVVAHVPNVIVCNRHIHWQHQAPLEKLIGLGFSNVETFRDLSEQSAWKFWAVGRKGEKDGQVA